MQANRCARCARRLLSTAAASLAPPRGMPDVLPPLARSHRRLQAAFWALAARAGYAELAPPLLEHTALFARSLGDTSDVVSKEMYSLTSPQGGGAGSSRSGSAAAAAAPQPPPPGASLTLRPEGTAGVLRAVLAAELHRAATPARVAYAGPMFRHERPQRGRQRQFTQVGLELVGSAAAGSGGALEDVEVIALAHDYLAAVLPPRAPPPVLLVNSLGADTRAHAQALAAHFGAVRGALSPDSQARLARGAPLRILDSKDPADAPHIASAPPAALPSADAARFEAVLAGLAALGIAAQRAPRLVRGLDYYTHTVFEFVVGGSAVLAGGRYDRLPAQLLGGSSGSGSGSGSGVCAIGWAAGVERLHLLCSEGEGGAAGEGAAPLVVALLPVAEEGGSGSCGAGAAALALWQACRRGSALGSGAASSIASSEAAFVALPPHSSLKKLLAKANAAGAGVVVIVQGGGARVLVKDMRSGAQCAAEGAEGVLAAVARVQQGGALA